jgi:hypothetical protein
VPIVFGVCTTNEKLSSVVGGADVRDQVKVAGAPAAGDSVAQFHPAPARQDRAVNSAGTSIVTFWFMPSCSTGTYTSSVCSEFFGTLLLVNST